MECDLTKEEIVLASMFGERGRATGTRCGPFCVAITAKHPAAAGLADEKK